MTRPSKREIERAIESLDAESSDADGHPVVFEDTETGEWYEDIELNGEPLDKDAINPSTVLVWRDEVIETGWELTEEDDEQ